MYAVIVNATGEVISFGTDLADPLPQGHTAIAIDRVPRIGERWNKTMRVVEVDPNYKDIPLLARTLLDQAKTDWQQATSDWSAAAAMPNSTTIEALAKLLAENAALRRGQVATIEAIRAIGRIVAIEDPP